MQGRDDLGRLPSSYSRLDSYFLCCLHLDTTSVRQFTGAWGVSDLARLDSLHRGFVNSPVGNVKISLPAYSGSKGHLSQILFINYFERIPGGDNCQRNAKHNQV
jgi:hypothetical protein